MSSLVKSKATRLHSTYICNSFVYTCTFYLMLDKLLDSINNKSLLKDAFEAGINLVKWGPPRSVFGPAALHDINEIRGAVRGRRHVWTEGRTGHRADLIQNLCKHVIKSLFGQVSVFKMTGRLNHLQNCFKCNVLISSLQLSYGQSVCQTISNDVVWQQAKLYVITYYVIRANQKTYDIFRLVLFLRVFNNSPYNNCMYM